MTTGDIYSHWLIQNKRDGIYVQFLGICMHELQLCFSVMVWADMQFNEFNGFIFETKQEIAYLPQKVTYMLQKNIVPVQNFHTFQNTLYGTSLQNLEIPQPIYIS